MEILKDAKVQALLINAAVVGLTLLFAKIDPTNKIVKILKKIVNSLETK